MSLADLLRRVFVRRSAGPVSSGNAEGLGEKRSSPNEREWAAAWLEAHKAGLLDPPRDVHSSTAWDEYWRNHLKVGPVEVSFNDQMSSDASLPSLLAAQGARTILCAGNGLSTEPFSLALLGFRVTALDISTMPAAAFAATMREGDHPLRRVPGSTLCDDGSLEFRLEGPIELSSPPPMHQSADYPPRGGGSLAFVTGDLTDPEVCPGPFDAIVERRTLQLFPDSERAAALERLVARLSNRGLFVSHQHDGSWRPGRDRAHFARSWLASHGFSFESASTPVDRVASARLARLVFTTG